VLTPRMGGALCFDAGRMFAKRLEKRAKLRVNSGWQHSANVMDADAPGKAISRAQWRREAPQNHGRHDDKCPTLPVTRQCLLASEVGVVGQLRQTIRR
jgi:hypothetical protein